MANVSLSFDAWKPGEVQSAMVEVPVRDGTGSKTK
jgi:hypothetical protein